jgi:hypothetical protein
MRPCFPLHRWDYVNAFMDKCLQDSNSFKDPDCIKGAMKKAHVDPARVDACMVESGGLVDNVNNTFFEKQKISIATAGVFLVPSLYVNQAPVRGALNFETTFKAICAGYAVGYEPEVCQTCSSCGDMKGCVGSGRCGGSGDGQGVSLQFFTTSFLGLAMKFLVVGYIVFQRQQRAMQHQVRGIMAQYMPLDDDGEEFTIT